jgi:hypothetical protein
MNKIKRMLRPTDFWHIGEHESWFSDMAQEGLHLKSVGIQFFKFTKGVPQNTKYRIDLSQGNKITTDQKEIYSQSGWEYVTSYGAFDVFASPVELNAPELHTDPAEQAYTLDDICKKTTKTAILITIMVAIMIIMIVSIWLFNPAPYLALIEGVIMQQAILIFVELFVVYSTIQTALSLRKLRNSLSEGKPIDHSAPWRKTYRLKKIIASLYILLAIFGAVIPIMQLTLSETNTLPIENTDLPIVRLADIEQNNELKRDVSTYSKDEIDRNNQYTYDWSPMAPTQYESRERGIITSKMWKDNSGEYSPSITTKVYQLSFTSTSESLISALIERHGLGYRGGDFIEMEHSGFDTLIVHEVDEFIEIFASKGKIVMHICYYGYADLNMVIEATAEKI